MARHALLWALLALGVACCAAIDLPATCPVAGATSCHGGIAPAGTATGVISYALQDLINIERLSGLTYANATSGVCSSLTFRCNAAMGVRPQPAPAFVLALSCEAA